MASDQELLRLAEEAILREASRGAERAAIHGPSGWLKPKLPPTNKRFLRNMLSGTVASNRFKDRSDQLRLEKKKRMFNESSVKSNNFHKCNLKQRSLLKSSSFKRTESSSSHDHNIFSTSNKSESVNKVNWNDDDGGLEISTTKHGRNDNSSHKGHNTKHSRGTGIKFVPSSNR